MSLRPPSSPDKDLLSAFDGEIAAEKAASLGRAGRKVEICLAALRNAGSGEAREPVLLAAAEAVQHYFIQRELFGLRDHRRAIADFGISGAVLARLGVRPKG